MAIITSVSSPTEVSINLDELADKIAAKLKVHLVGLPVSTNNRLVATDIITNTLDESLVDVGVSTAGIVKGSDTDLAKQTTKVDNTASATDKLRALKKKD